MGLTRERWCCAGGVCRLDLNTYNRRVYTPGILLRYRCSPHHGSTRRHKTPQGSAKEVIVYVCMYGHTYNKSMDQPGKVANSVRGQLNKEK